MKLPISLLVLLAATVAFAEPPEAVQRVTLDERAVVTVPVATNRVTTISFPGPITAIDAVGVTADGKTPGQFQFGSEQLPSCFRVTCQHSRLPPLCAGIKLARLRTRKD